MKKNILFITILIFILFTQVNIYGQDFTFEERIKINKKVLDLIEKYKKYGNLSENGTNISEAYVSEFKKLFDSKYSKIYNDIEPLPLNKLVKLKNYLENIKTWYPNGIAISISDMEIDEKFVKIKKNRYAATVKVEKTVLGIYMNEKRHMKKTKLYFIVLFDKSETGIFENFRIKALQDEKLSEYKIRKIANRARIFYYSYGSYGFSAPEIYSDIKIDNSSGYSFGFESVAKITQEIDFSVGIGFSKHSSRFETNDYFNSFSAIDSDEEDYERRVKAKNVSESHSLVTINFPIKFKYKYYIGFFDLYFEAGTKLFINAYKNVTGQGTFSYSGYYSQYNIELLDLEKYGFPSNKEIYRNEKLDFKPFGFSLILGFGTIVNISQNIKIGIGINADIGLTNINKNSPTNYQLSKDENDYNSLLYSASRVAPLAIGTKFSLIFNF